MPLLPLRGLSVNGMYVPIIINITSLCRLAIHGSSRSAHSNRHDTPKATNQRILQMVLRVLNCHIGANSGTRLVALRPAGSGTLEHRGVQYINGAWTRFVWC
jgi:hypothetical protein